MTNDRSPQDTDNADQIRRDGWRQGSILPELLHQELVAADIIPGRFSSGIALVLSHDCDITNRSLRSEPSAEIIVARRVSNLDGSCTQGKNPRRLDFEVIEDNQTLPYRTCPDDRFRIPRERFLGWEPDPGKRCEGKTVRCLANWISRRYLRAAFPDEFNERLRDKRKTIKQVLQRRGHDLTAVYLSLNSTEELPASAIYQVSVFATMRVDDYEVPSKREHAQEAVDEIAEAMHDCEGILLADASLVSEADVTLDDLLYMIRWDTYEYLSGTADDGLLVARD
jgi:hypothetical protein